MRILLVEDDVLLSDLIVRCLREESYAVDAAGDGQEGEWMAFENPYDLIILDLMLPRKNGMEVLCSIRKAKIDCPILILTARDATGDRVAGLDGGADDYLTKPFSIDELTARVRALLRRKLVCSPSVIDLGELKIDPARKEVHVEGQLVEFTAKEYGLLEYFSRNSGQVLSRTQLSEHVWDLNYELNSNVVDVYVGYLRSKLATASTKNFIKTIRGHGYMLDTDHSRLDRGIDLKSQAEISSGIQI